MTAGRRWDTVVCLAGFAWAAALLCLAGPPTGDKHQRITVGRAQEAPPIDGGLSEPCWAAATALTGFELNVDAGGLAANQTRARLCFDQTHLYLAVEVAQPAGTPPGKTADRDTDGLFGEHTCELFFLPPLGDGRRTRFHLAFNSAGTVYDARLADGADRDAANAPPDVAWTLESLRIATSPRRPGWTAELAIPFASLGKSPGPNGQWAFNLCRNDPDSDEYSSWAQIVGRFDQPECWNTLTFEGEDGLIVRHVRKRRGGGDYLVIDRPNATFAEIVSDAPGGYVTWAREAWDGTPASMKDPAARQRDYERRLRMRHKQCAAGMLGEVIPWAVRTDFFGSGIVAESSAFLTTLHEKYGTTSVWDYMALPGHNIFADAHAAGAPRLDPSKSGPVERGGDIFLADPLVKVQLLANIERFGKMLKGRPFVSYVLGGDEEYLAPYRGDLSAAPEQIKRWDGEIKRDFGFGRYGTPDLTASFRTRGIKERGYQDLECIAFMRWAQHRYFKDLREYRRAIETINPEWEFGTGAMGSIRSLTGWDFDALGEIVDVVNDDPYCSGEASGKGRGIYNHGFTAKLESDVTGVQVGVFVQGFTHRGVAPTPERLREWTSQAIKAGATMINFYLGEQATENSPLHNEAVRLAGMLKTLGALKRAESDSAILFSQMSRFSDGPCGAGDKPYTAYGMLAEHVGASFRFVSDTQLDRGKATLEGFKTVYVPRAEYMTGKTARALDAYVRGGGFLVVGDPLAFSRQIDGKSLVQFRRRLCGFELLKRIHPKRILLESNKLLDLGTARVELPVFDGNGNREPRWWRPNDRFDVRVMPGAVVVGTYGDGKPAVVINRLGDGRVLAFASNPFMPSSLATPSVERPTWAGAFRAIHRSAGCAVDEPIWRFELPGPDEAPAQGSAK